MTDNYQLAAKWIHQSDGLLITAGAGMGVDSGLPDFRGDQGLWQSYPALRKQNIRFVDIANPQFFNSDPWTAWGFYGHRLNLYRSTKPHNGFRILRQWGQSKPQGGFVFTSNVDGQFQQAGFDTMSIFECHGSIHQLQCKNDCEGSWAADNFKPIIHTENCRIISDLPVCPRCGHSARPNILTFGDWNWQDELYRRQMRRYQTWLSQVEYRVVIELGAGIHIPTVRHESERRTRNRLIRINPRAAEIPDGMGISFTTGAMETLSRINEFLTRL